MTSILYLWLVVFLASLTLCYCAAAVVLLTLAGHLSEAGRRQQLGQDGLERGRE